MTAEPDFTGATCQETLGIHFNEYIRCGATADLKIQHRGRTEGPYFMCVFHGVHNVRNRDAEILAVRPGIRIPR